MGGITLFPWMALMPAMAAVVAVAAVVHHWRSRRGGSPGDGPPVV